MKALEQPKNSDAVTVQVQKKFSRAGHPTGPVEGPRHYLVDKGQILALE